MPVKLAKFDVDVDGKPVSFIGPADMTDDQARQRAQQEAGVSSGSIPTTWGGGYKRGVGEEALKAADAGTTHAGMSAIGALLGVLTANPKVAQAGMTVLPSLAKAGLQKVGHALTGTEDPRDGWQRGVDTAKDVGMDAAFAYGPGMVSRTISSLAKIGGNTFMKPLGALAAGVGKLGEDTNASAVLPENWVPAARKALDAGGEAVTSAARSGASAIGRLGTGVSADDLTLLDGLLKNGMRRSAALKVIANGDPEIMKALDTLARQSPWRSAASKLTGGMFAAAPMAATAQGEPDKVGDTNSSVALLQRQQRDAVKNQLQNRLQSR